MSLAKLKKRVQELSLNLEICDIGTTISVEVWSDKFLMDGEQTITICANKVKGIRAKLYKSMLDELHPISGVTITDNNGD